MPPCFMARISRSSSGFLTAGPNHHQRIMIRESSGGCSKPRCTAATVCAAAGAAKQSTARTLHAKKRFIEFLCHGCIQRPQISYGAAVDDGLGRRFQNLQAVKRLQNIGPGHQYAVIFEQHGRLLRPDGLGQRDGIGELKAEGCAPHLAQHNIAFRDRTGVERSAGYAECGRIHRVSIDDRADVGMATVNRVVQSCSTTGILAAFGPAAAYEYEFLWLNDPTIRAVRRDDERVAVHPRGVAALAADEQALAIGSQDKFRETPPDLLLFARRRNRREGLQRAVALPLQLELVLGEIADVAAKQAGLDDRLRAELQGFEAAECLVERLARGDDAVVFENDAVESVGKGAGDDLAECAAAGQAVGREADLAADLPGLVEEARVRNLVDETEGDQRDGVGVNDAREFGAPLADLAVDWQFGGRLANAVDGAVGSNADDVFAPQASFVDARGRDPHVPIG